MRSHTDEILDQNEDLLVEGIPSGSLSGDRAGWAYIRSSATVRPVTVSFPPILAAIR